MSVENLQELFIEEMRDIYDAEKQLVTALPKMANAAQSDDLRTAFEEHLDATRVHIDRLTEIFNMLGMPARGKPCEAMKGLIDEGLEGVDKMEGAVLDAALIAAAQKVEHYEIATYGTLATFAQVLNLQDAKAIIGRTLHEEKAADDLLTHLAGRINFEADSTGDADEDDDQTRTWRQ